MPFKTKKQKIKALKKRVTVSASGVAAYQAVETSNAKEVALHTPDVVSKEDSAYSANYSYAIRDVTKTIVLALLIIGSQIILKISGLSFL